MPSQTREPRILIINESLDILNLFHDILDDGRGYDVELSNFKFEGLKSVINLKPDLIIIDFAREGRIEEWQLLQMIKMSVETAHIPIILSLAPLFLAGEWEAHFTRKNVQLLYKPFLPDELLELVQQILPLPRAKD